MGNSALSGPFGLTEMTHKLTVIDMFEWISELSLLRESFCTKET